MGVGHSESQGSHTPVRLGVECSAFDNDKLRHIKVKVQQTVRGG